MSGIPSEPSLSQHDAVNMLLNMNDAPEEASEEVQEPSADTEVEATETETEEVEAVQEDQAETEYEEVEEETDAETETEVEETVDVYNVKLDGETREATVDELIAEYQKGKTGDKRLQEASEARKALDRDKASFDVTRVEYTDRLQKITDFLESQAPQNIEAQISELEDVDPIEAAKIERRENARLKNLEAVRVEQLRVENETRIIEAEKLKDLIPEWRDPAVQEREGREIMQYVQSKNLPDVAIKSMSLDSRLVDMARKAMKFENLQGQKPIAKKKIVKAPKMVKSGQPKPASSSATERKRKAFDKLRKSGSRNDAVDYLLSR
jgi:hypothetical protein